MTARRTIASPIGPLVLESDGGALTAIRFGADGAAPGLTDPSPGGSPASDTAPAAVLTTDGILDANAALDADGLLDADAVPHAGAVLDATARQLEEYFAGTRTTFDLPLRPSGTDFQRAVWSGLEEIPYGETRSYGELAARVGRPKAARAIGAGCGRNPIPVVVPCHRVIGADGTLTGYAGGTDIKNALLRLEARTLAGGSTLAAAAQTGAAPR